MTDAEHVLSKLATSSPDRAQFTQLCHWLELHPNPTSWLDKLVETLAHWPALDRCCPDGKRRRDFLAGKEAVWDPLVGSVGLGEHEVGDVLRSSPRASTLKGIHVRGPQAQGARGIAAAELATADHLSALRAVAFVGNAHVGSEALRILLRSPIACQLTELCSEAGGHHDDLIEELLSTHLGTLRILRLPRNPLGADAARHLTRLSLEELDLSGTGLGAAGALAVAKMPGLHRLALRNCGLSGDTVQALVEATRGSDLTQLLLEDNAVGYEGVLALAAAQHLDAATRLPWQARAQRWEAIAGRVQNPAGDPVLRRARSRATVQVFITVHRGHTVPGEHIGLVGDAPELGAWKDPLLLTPSNYPTWSGVVELPARSEPAQYKMVKVLESGRLQWEECANRTMYLHSDGPLYIEQSWE